MENFNKKIFFWGLLIYIATRVFSFYFPPTSLIAPGTWPNDFISIALLLAAIYFFWKKQNWGWYLVAGELLLGGSGNYLQFWGISLRTLFLVIALFFYFTKNYKTIITSIRSHEYPTLAVLTLLVMAGISAGIGLPHSHSPQLVYTDFIPYLFLLYYFPWRELINNKNFISFAISLGAAAILGNLLQVSLAFFLFSSGIEQIQGPFYLWWRHIAGGKATDWGMNFFRIVLNEQILLAPAILYVIYKNIINSRWINYLLISALAIISALNLTRIYALALIIGFVVLWCCGRWQTWLKNILFFCLIFISSFSTIYFAASRGTSFGWNVLFSRAESITSPSEEGSSLSRMLLLAPIGQQIRQHPLLGNGLGSTVDVYSPIVHKNITTSFYDWGYFEILAEMGLIGLLVWLIFLFAILKQTYTNILVSALSKSVLVINLTSPALFHVLGIILLVILLAQNSKKYVNA